MGSDRSVHHPKRQMLSETSTIPTTTYPTAISSTYLLCDPGRPKSRMMNEYLIAGCRQHYSQDAWPLLPPIAPSPAHGEVKCRLLLYCVLCTVYCVLCTVYSAGLSDLSRTASCREHVLRHISHTSTPSLTFPPYFVPADADAKRTRGHLCTTTNYLYFSTIQRGIFPIGHLFRPLSVFADHSCVQSVTKYCVVVRVRP